MVANFLMLHLGRPERAAKEFARALVPGGRVALTVWDLPEQARFLGVLVEAVAEAEATPPDDIHVESSPESLWRGLLGGTVRVSALILWPREMQQRIRAGEARLGPQVGTSR